MCGRRRMEYGSGAHCARPAEPAGGPCEGYPKGVIWPNLFFASIRGMWPRMDTDEGGEPRRASSGSNPHFFFLPGWRRA